MLHWEQMHAGATLHGYEAHASAPVCGATGVTRESDDAMPRYVRPTSAPLLPVCGACKAYERDHDDPMYQKGLREGVALERAHVVAWLRAEGRHSNPWHLGDVADFVEKGEHESLLAQWGVWNLTMDSWAMPGVDSWHESREAAQRECDAWVRRTGCKYEPRPRQAR